MKKYFRIASFILAYTLSLTACGNTENHIAQEGVTITGDDVIAKDEIIKNEVEIVQREENRREDESTSNLSSMEEPATAEDKDKIAKAGTRFGFDILKQSIKEEAAEGKNILISPLSLYEALAMTTNGASGVTLEEMQNVVTNPYDIKEFNKLAASYREYLGNISDVSFNIANSIWMKDSEDLRNALTEEFIGDTGYYYGADIMVKDFDQNTIADINSWVDESTNHMILELINEIPPQTIMFLINAIAFEGKWEEEFGDDDILEEHIFTNHQGEEETCTMLSSANGEYMNMAGADAFVRDYAGGDLAFVGILPPEDVSLSEYIDTLSWEEYLDLWSKSRLTDVYYEFPEFSYEYGARSMKQDLINLGMTSAFGVDEETPANFYGMLKDYETQIDDVIHKTFIEVNKEGTKAAAATAVIMTKATAVGPNETKTIILDRPFMYMIVDKNNGMPLFIGAVNSLNMQEDMVEE